MLARDLDLLGGRRLLELPVDGFLRLAGARAPGDHRRLARAGRDELRVPARGRPETPPALVDQAREVLLDLGDRQRASEALEQPADRLRRLPLDELRAWPRAPPPSAAGSAPAGSGVRFFSAETSDSGSFAPATSRRITSSAGFISTIRPAPRPGDEVDLAGREPQPARDLPRGLRRVRGALQREVREHGREGRMRRKPCPQRGLELLADLRVRRGHPRDLQEHRKLAVAVSALRLVVREEAQPGERRTPRPPSS